MTPTTTHLAITGLVSATLMDASDTTGTGLNTKTETCTTVGNTLLKVESTAVSTEPTDITPTCPSEDTASLTEEAAGYSEDKAGPK